MVHSSEIKKQKKQKTLLNYDSYELLRKLQLSANY